MTSSQLSNVSFRRRSPRKQRKRATRIDIASEDEDEEHDIIFVDDSDSNDFVSKEKEIGNTQSDSGLELEQEDESSFQYKKKYSEVRSISQAKLTEDPNESDSDSIQIIDDPVVVTRSTLKRKSKCKKKREPVLSQNYSDEIDEMTIHAYPELTIISNSTDDETDSDLLTFNNIERISESRLKELKKRDELVSFPKRELRRMTVGSILPSNSIILGSSDEVQEQDISSSPFDSMPKSQDNEDLTDKLDSTTTSTTTPLASVQETQSISQSITHNLFKELTTRWESEPEISAGDPSQQLSSRSKPCPPLSSLIGSDSTLQPASPSGFIRKSVIPVDRRYRVGLSKKAKVDSLHPKFLKLRGRESNDTN